MKRRFPHPGTLLREQFIEPMGLTPYRLAKEIGVPSTRLSAILAGQRSVTPDMGLRLDHYIGLSEGYWSGLQNDYDVRVVKRRIAGDLKRIRRHRAKSQQATV